MHDGTDQGVLSRLVGQAGWIPIRYEWMTGTNHYLVIFVQKNLFSTESELKKRIR